MHLLGTTTGFFFFFQFDLNTATWYTVYCMCCTYLRVSGIRHFRIWCSIQHFLCVRYWINRYKTNIYNFFFTAKGKIENTNSNEMYMDKFSCEWKQICCVIENNNYMYFVKMQNLNDERLEHVVKDEFDMM